MSLSGLYEDRRLIMKFDPEIHLKSLSYEYLTASFNYHINSLDTKHFPNRGTLLDISASTSKLISGKMRTDSSKITYTASHTGEFSFNRFFILQGSFKHYFSKTDK